MKKYDEDLLFLVKEFLEEKLDVEKDDGTEEDEFMYEMAVEIVSAVIKNQEEN